MTVLWSSTKETLNRSRTLKSSRRLQVDEKSSSRNILGPEVRGNRRDKHESVSCLKQVTMLTLRDTILSVSTRTRVLRKSALLSEKAT